MSVDAGTVKRIKSDDQGTVLDWTCSHLHGRPAFGPNTGFVYPGCWNFDKGATSKMDDILTEKGGLLHVLLLAVHLNILIDM